MGFVMTFEVARADDLRGASADETRACEELDDAGAISDMYGFGAIGKCSLYVAGVTNCGDSWRRTGSTI